MLISTSVHLYAAFHVNMFIDLNKSAFISTYSSYHTVSLHQFHSLSRSLFLALSHTHTCIQSVFSAKECACPALDKKNLPTTQYCCLSSVR